MAKTLAQELSDASDTTAESWIDMSQDQSYSRELRCAFAAGAIQMEEIAERFRKVAKELEPINLEGMPF